MQCKNTYKDERKDGERIERQIWVLNDLLRSGRKRNKSAPANSTLESVSDNMTLEVPEVSAASIVRSQMFVHPTRMHRFNNVDENDVGYFRN